MTPQLGLHGAPAGPFAASGMDRTATSCDVASNMISGVGLAGLESVPVKVAAMACVVFSTWGIRGRRAADPIDGSSAGINKLLYVF